MDAIRKLPPRRGTRMIPVDLVILRIARNGSLKNSAPCFKCIEHLDRLNKKTTYRLRYIYYSDISGNITKIKFTTLYFSEQKHVSMRFRTIKFPEKEPKQKKIKKSDDD